MLVKSVSTGVVLVLSQIVIAQTYGYSDDAVVDIGSTLPDSNPNQLRLWLTISARKRFIEISWKNAPARSDDNILLTKQKPINFSRIKLNATTTPLAVFDAVDRGSSSIPIDGVTIRTSSISELSRFAGINLNSPININANTPLGDSSRTISRISGTQLTSTPAPQQHHYWISNNGANDIVAAIQPSLSTQWFTTGVPFNYEITDYITKNTSCYGYWASYINGEGSILATTCFRAYPTWMHDLSTVIGSLRMRDLFIPGTHDSGSYRPKFDPLLQETIVTKYALTQDEDVRTQLMHGARYLDIRVGYYRNTPEKFFINHGITRQRPLREIIEQVKAFVLDTNEIVIFGLKEFPVGFGRTLGVHRLLVHFIQEQFGDLIVHPSVKWSGSLHDIWSRRQNVIIAYDKPAIVNEFPHLLFTAVEQRWGNVQNWVALERHLRMVNSLDVSRLSSRPVADMAELTPEPWGVIVDKYGGLRKLADNVNWRVSQLYRDDLARTANIVAVDFMRGTVMPEIAIDWNKRKITY
ncbi:uncharacterized protein LOC119687099 [Teleopsis dalmanni]|uniref:uncharacterized protein LOC119687099 n=1 Tax=Teleopsis dalmanni TaxID=139649 RepID=UPI000D329D70|nr:uncharacterized protein LOC119687099 [Teleopsis dalmanni]